MDKLFLILLNAAPRNTASYTNCKLYRFIEAFMAKFRIELARF